MSDRRIRVIAKRPDSDWYVTNLSDNLKNYQNFVEGPIEVVGMFEDHVIVCNENGRLIGLEPNCEIAGIDFVGNIFLVGTKDDEFDDAKISLKTWKGLIGQVNALC